MGEGLPQAERPVMIHPMQTDPLLRNRARIMRRAMTEPETRLWLALRGRRLAGAKFVRQMVIGPYIADFAARSHKLVIEVDGDTHSDQSRDARRTAWLERQGYRVLRFSNSDVMGNMESVLTTVSVALAAPLTQPSPQRGGGCK